MNALVCAWGGDLSAGPGGDLNVAPVQAELQQRIIRRLLTNAGDYIWHTNYGAGLGSFVGESYSPDLVHATILGQLQYETVVASSPSPIVNCDRSISDTTGSISVNIQYQIVGGPSANTVTLELGR
jgi:hypothetical protein